MISRISGLLGSSIKEFTTDLKEKLEGSFIRAYQSKQGCISQQLWRAGKGTPCCLSYWHGGLPYAGEGSFRDHRTQSTEKECLGSAQQLRRGKKKRKRKLCPYSKVGGSSHASWLPSLRGYRGGRNSGKEQNSSSLKE